MPSQQKVDHLDGLLDSQSPDDLIKAIRARSQERNRAAQAQIAAPPTMASDDWAARKAWLLDGQQIHGTLEEFYFPALEALQGNNQAEYSAKRDLLFKALRTMLGDIWNKPVERKPEDAIAVPASPAPPPLFTASPEAA